MIIKIPSKIMGDIYGIYQTVTTHTPPSPHTQIVSCLNPMSVSGPNWRDCVTIQNEVSMVDMNVKNVYKEEQYDSVSMNEIDSASVVKEMIDVRDGSVKC